jgi:hypothetical protein
MPSPFERLFAIHTRSLAPSRVGLSQVRPVTPVQIFAGPFKSGSYGVLTLDFIPEPFTLLTQSAGIPTLAYLGARRQSG